MCQEESTVINTIRIISVLNAYYGDSAYCVRIKSVVNQQNARLAFVDNSRNDSLVNKCEKIRREYRNKAAHIDIVTKRQAENCYRAVIGKIDAYDYNTNVTSALLELFSILK